MRLHRATMRCHAEPHLVKREYWDGPVISSLREVLTVVREG